MIDVGTRREAADRGVRGARDQGRPALRRDARLLRVTIGTPEETQAFLAALRELVKARAAA